jgi:tetratricopeptide (TPR) repeat protein
MSVRVFADQQFRARPNWRETIAARFAAANRVFAPAVQLHWEVAAINDWETVPGEAAEQHRRRLTGFLPNSGAVAVGFTGEPVPNAGLGIAVPFDPRVLVFDRSNESEARNELALEQQLARLFGAWPSSDPSSLMHNPPGASLDGVTVEAIRAARDFDTRRGAIGLSQEQKDRIAASWAKGKGSAAPRLNPLFQHYFAVGNELLTAGRTGEAAEWLSRAVSVYPEDASVHTSLAAAYMARAQWLQAVPELRKVTELDPKSAPAFNLLGGAYLRARRFQEAADAFRQAVALQPGDANYHSNTGVALGHIGGQREAALAQLHEALRLKPGHAAATAALAGIGKLN